MPRPPRIPNWLPHEQASIYFLTFCVKGRKQVLANESIWQIILEQLKKLDDWHLLTVLAMPDHLHLLVSPKHRDNSVTVFSRWFKRGFNAQAKPNWKWQEGCFDRLLRTNESASQKWEYIRHNPVRAGLVTKSDDWSYQKAFIFV
jgi:putative transposase